MVIRIPYGGAIGAVEHHSESPEAYFTHTAGLRVITPSTANDAYWMTRQAIECEDPVIVFEPKRHYWLRGEVDLDHAPEESAFQARIARPGEDATVVAWGPTVSTALEAAALARRRAAVWR